MYPQQNIEDLKTSDNERMAAELLDLAGSRIIDIGCGEGDLTRALARGGAVTTGIDPHEGRIEKARAAAAAEGLSVNFEVGIGEELPCPDGEFDVALLSNSLHHVPEDRMEATIREAIRVVRRGGLVYFVEPVPTGPFFEVQSIWNDETANRASAYEEIERATELGCETVTEVFYRSARPSEDVESYLKRAAERHPKRQELISEKADEIRRKFAENAVPAKAGGSTLEMVYRINLMRKKA